MAFKGLPVDENAKWIAGSNTKYTFNAKWNSQGVVIKKSEETLAKLRLSLIPSAFSAKFNRVFHESKYVVSDVAYMPPDQEGWMKISVHLVSHLFLLLHKYVVQSYHTYGCSLISFL
jgi:hypothetical protein